MAASRNAILGLVLLSLPLAAAQTLPTTEVPALPTPPSPDVAEEDVLGLGESLVELEGDPQRPSLLRVLAPDGSAAVTYRVNADGRSSVTVADQMVLDDATLVAIEGAPTDDAFTLHLRDAEGNPHAVRIDRAALAANLPLPDVPPVSVARPPEWPGAPRQAYLAFVSDPRPNHVPAAQLDGTRHLQLSGPHAIFVQMPIANATYDRLAFEAWRAADPNVTIEGRLDRNGGTTDAAIFRGAFDPAQIAGAQDGDTIHLRVFYERRLSPLAVERFAEDADYRYKLDGRGPTVAVNAAREASDFRFALAWSGEDARTGVSGFRVDHRVAGAATWTRWLDGAAARSATFSGAWGTTYEFRVTSLDGVGNPSAAPATATVTVVPQPAGNDDVNDPPTARLLAPAAGEVLAGAALVTWQATDPDATPVTSRLEVSGDDGRTWRALYVGGDASYSWLTSAELDGAYRLRLTVSDGAQSVADAVGGLVVRNVQAAPASKEPVAGAAAGPGGAPAGLTPATAPPAALQEPQAPAAVPGPGLLLAALALAGAAMAARRR